MSGSLHVKRKFQVFISSTYLDMRDERQAAVEAVLEAGHIPAGMELFAAGDESQWKVIQAWIEESDIFMLILGGRYGSIADKHRKSYIHLEYEYAMKLKKPLFALVMDDAALNEKVRSRGKDVLELENGKRYAEFKKIVQSVMCSIFKTTDELKLQITRSLNFFLDRESITGWVSGKLLGGSESNSALPGMYQALQAENEALKEKVKSLTSVILAVGNRFDLLYSALIFETESNLLWAKDIFTSFNYLRDEAWVSIKNNGYTKFLGEPLAAKMADVYNKLHGLNQRIYDMREAKYKSSAANRAIAEEYRRAFLEAATEFRQLLTDEQNVIRKNAQFDMASTVDVTDQPPIS